MLKKLIESCHAAVFDKSPCSVVAFRLRHSDGAAWAIADRVLTVTVGAGAVEAYPLDGVTVEGLAGQLLDDGLYVIGLSAELRKLSALVLLDGSGGPLVSNGDQVLGYTSLLWVLLSGYAAETTAAKLQIAEALKQMLITQAEGEWLDLWGALYGVPRADGEADADYAPRIPLEAFRRRNNARSIELAIRDATGYDVRIEEPWREIFTLDKSRLSGSHKLCDGVIVNHHLIRPVAIGAVDWSVVLPVIERNRAAGVIVVNP